MKTIIERICAVVLGLGGVGHAVGAYMGYKQMPLTLLWALCASLFLFLLASVNYLRSARPGDGALAVIAITGNLAWIAVSLAFGTLTGHLFDVRVVVFIVLCIALIGFALAGRKA